MQQGRCPRCNSPDVRPTRWDPLAGQLLIGGAIGAGAAALTASPVGAALSGIALAVGTGATIALRRTGLTCTRCGRRHTATSTTSTSDYRWKLDRIEARIEKVPHPTGWDAAPEVVEVLAHKVQTSQHALQRRIETIRSVSGSSWAGAPRDLGRLAADLERLERVAAAPRPQEYHEAAALKVLADHVERTLHSSRRRVYVLSVSPEQVKVMSSLDLRGWGERNLTIRVQMHESDDDLVILSSSRGDTLAQRYVPHSDWGLGGEEAEVYATLRSDGFATTEALQAAKLLV